MPTVEFSCLPKQWEFLHSCAPEVLYSGALGAGKSLALCLKVYDRARHPGAREGLFRLTYKSLRATTLQTLLAGDGDCPPVLQPGKYTYLVSQDKIKIAGGGEIILGGLDPDRDPEFAKIGSLNLTGCAFDQCEECPAKAWSLLGGRCRVSHPNIPIQLYGVCNPGAPSHHLAERFGIRTGTTPADFGQFGRAHLIETNTLENPHLPPQYIARLSLFKGTAYKRYVLGKWVANEGTVYDRWDREIHMRVRTGPWVRQWLAWDDGYSNPCFIGLVGEDSDGRLHLIAEVYERQLSEGQKVERALALAGGDPSSIEAVVIDPSAAAMKGALRAAGFNVIDGDNDVLAGINTVQSLLEVRGDGQPRFTADPSCLHTGSDFETYHWDPDSQKDKVIKEHDHACDGIRYLAMNIRQPDAMVFSVSDLRHVVQRAESHPPEEVGVLDFGVEDPVKRASDIGKGAWGKVVFREPRKGAPPLRIWHELYDGKPRQDRRRVMFAQVGAGASPSLIHVGDIDGRELVAVWEKVATVEEVAEAVALLGLWYGREKRATVGWMRFGPSAGLDGALRRLKHSRKWIPIGGTEVGWDPQPEEMGTACMEVREVLANGSFVVPVAEVARDARAYVWNDRGGVEHAATVGDPAARAGHTDHVRGLVGLWRIMDTSQGERRKVLDKMRA